MCPECGSDEIDAPDGLDAVCIDCGHTWQPEARALADEASGLAARMTELRAEKDMTRRIELLTGVLQDGIALLRRATNAAKKR